MRVCFICVLLCGVPVSALGILAAALFYAEMDLPSAVQTLLAVLPVMLGAWCAAYRSGNRLRRGGMLCGIRCGVLLSGGWYLLAGVFAGFGFPLCIVCAVPCGIWGGIIGVSRPAPAIRKRNHALRRIPETVILNGAHAAAVRRTKHTAKE